MTKILVITYDIIYVSTAQYEGKIKTSIFYSKIIVISSKSSLIEQILVRLLAGD